MYIYIYTRIDRKKDALILHIDIRQTCHIHTYIYIYIYYVCTYNIHTIILHLSLSLSLQPGHGDGMTRDPLWLTSYEMVEPLKNTREKQTKLLNGELW